MENLTTRTCWELVKKKGYTTVWRKPVNNTCYAIRGAGVQPPICDSDDDPENVWCEPFDTYPRTYDLLHATGKEFRLLGISWLPQCHSQNQEHKKHHLEC